MSRTKRPSKQVGKPTPKNAEKTISVALNKETLLLSAFLADINTEQTNLLQDHLNILSLIETIVMCERMKIPAHVGNKTLAEIRSGKSFEKSSMFFDSGSIAHYLDSTHNQNTTKTILKRKKPSDEAESTRTASADRSTARTRSNQGVKTKRTSRSLSRSKMPKNVTIQMPAPPTQTPMEKRMPSAGNFAFVTPKVKPNTPLTVLRRPMQGEVAISMQGSPLLVSGVITETCANVNIPLNDGRVLSLQPTHNIRMSQLPNLDKETREQLARLRDNLNKVCQFTNQD